MKLRGAHFVLNSDANDTNDPFYPLLVKFKFGKQTPRKGKIMRCKLEQWF